MSDIPGILSRRLDPAWHRGEPSALLPDHRERMAALLLASEGVGRATAAYAEAIAGAADAAALQAVRNAALSRESGAFSEALALMPSLTAEDKRSAGRALNLGKQLLEALEKAKREALERAREDAEIPMNSHFYPQLVPANWSLTYVLPGSPVIQFFAKGLMPLFAVMMLLGLFNLVLLTKNYHFLVSIILLQQLLSSYLNTGIYSGYVDIAVSFFTFAALYILLNAHDTPETDQRSQLYILGALLSAGAAVAKQAGVYIALCYPVLVYADIVFSKVQVEKKQVKTWLGLFAAISIIWVSWYAFKQIAIWTGADYANIDTLVNISAGRYENMSAFQRIVTSLSQRLEMVILFLLILLAFPWMDRLYKVLTILFAPYPLLWGWMASYDTRNLAVFLPVLALVAGYSIHFLLLQLVKMGERGRVLQTPVYVLVAFACVALVGLSFVLTPARLQQRQLDLQRQILSPAKNQLLFDLIAENGSQTRILTNYPMKYIPGLEEYQVRFDFHDYDAFLANVKNPEVEYLLVPNAIDREIKDYINARVEAGDYQVIVKDKQWKVFTLIRILNREDPSLQDSE